MYRYYIPKRSPVAFWLLDDAVPFQDQSGFSVEAGKKTGTADPATSVPLVAGASYSSVFSSASVGRFKSNLFKQGLENRPFVIEAWVLPIPKTSTGPQQILSHDGHFDGLSIDGKVIKFSTKYATSGEAACDYDLQEYKLAHVLGVHNDSFNQLWVNGEMVATVALTEEQKGDTYIATDEYLYSGFTASTQQIAMNGVAFYGSLSGEQIMQNYLAGTNTIGQARVTPQFDGQTFALNAETGSVFVQRTWADEQDFESGLKQSVEYAPDQIDPAYVDGLSVPGSWTTAVPLDVSEATSIYGVLVAWSGSGISVDLSLDGSTWTPAVSGELTSLIPPGFDPTDKDLEIRVSFAGGLAEDPSYLESLTVIAYENNNISNDSTRTITATSPAVMRDDYEPTLYRDDNGILLDGGSLTIGPDTTPDADAIRTVELWIKTLSGTPTINVSGTQYRNGYPGSAFPVGEWTLVHIVSATDITSDIVISGNCIVGQATLYPDGLTAANVEFIFKSYTRNATILIQDSNTITIGEPAVPAKIYTHDWAIDSAG